MERQPSQCTWVCGRGWRPGWQSGLAGGLWRGGLQVGRPLAPVNAQQRPHPTRGPERPGSQVTSTGTTPVPAQQAGSKVRPGRSPAHQGGLAMQLPALGSLVHGGAAMARASPWAPRCLRGPPAPWGDHVLPGPAHTLGRMCLSSPGPCPGPAGHLQQGGCSGPVVSSPRRRWRWAQQDDLGHSRGGGLGTMPHKATAVIRHCAQ